METKYEVREITPKVMQCACGGCVSIHEYRDSYLIVGKVEDPADFGLEGKVGEGEQLISVSKKLIDNKQV